MPKVDRSLGVSTPLTPPLFQSSVYTLPDLDALDRIMNAEETGFTYARDGHPNAKWLGEELAAIENASWGLVCGSGMASITAGLLALVQKGDHIVASNRLYGRTTQLLTQELPRFGVETTFVDGADLRRSARGVGPALARVVRRDHVQSPVTSWWISRGWRAWLTRAAPP